MRYFIMGMSIMFIMGINLKILLKSKKTNFWELAYMATIMILTGSLHYIMIIDENPLSSLALYAIPPLLLTPWMIRKGYTLKNSLSIPFLGLFIWILAELTMWLAWVIILEVNFENVSTQLALNLVLTISVTSTLLAVFSEYLTRGFRQRINHSANLESVLLLITTSAFIVTNLTMISFDVIANISITPFILVVVSLLLALLFGGILAFSFILYAKNLEGEYQIKRKEDERMAMIYYVNEIEKQSLEIRKFKHDYLNILISMDGYFNAKNYDELEDYFREKVKKSVPSFLASDSDFSDLGRIKIQEIKSILTFKLMLAKELGIEVKFEANETIELIPINTIDLIRIIGILLDNAIEALADLPVRKLQVGLLKSDENIILIIKNSCCPELPKLHELKKSGFSTKGDGRGLGLSNLAELIGDYEYVFLETMIIENTFIQKMTIDSDKIR